MVDILSSFEPLFSPTVCSRAADLPPSLPSDGGRSATLAGLLGPLCHPRQGFASVNLVAELGYDAVQPSLSRVSVGKGQPGVKRCLSLTTPSLWRFQTHSNVRSEEF